MVGLYRDRVIEEFGLVLEFDGRLGHADPTGRLRDFRRDNAVAASDDVALRFGEPTSMKMHAVRPSKLPWCSIAVAGAAISPLRTVLPRDLGQSARNVAVSCPETTETPHCWAARQKGGKGALVGGAGDHRG